LFLHEVLVGEGTTGVRHQRSAERLHTACLDLQPGGHPMAAEPDQVLCARRQAGMQVVGGDAAPRPPTPALAVQRHEHERPVVALDQAGGHDADHAGVPTLPVEDMCDCR
jgi:hypothetical protein